MSELRNGHIFLMGLQPYFTEYILVEYVEYDCYYPWLREFTEIFIVYDFLTEDFFLPKESIPNLESLPLLYGPMAVRPWSKPKNISILSRKPRSTDQVPHLLVQNNYDATNIIIDDQQLTNRVECPSLLFSTELNIYSSEINSVDLKHIEFGDLILTVDLPIRTSLEVMKKRGIPAETLYSLSGSDSKSLARRIINIYSDIDYKPISTNMLHKEIWEGHAKSYPNASEFEFDITNNTFYISYGITCVQNDKKVTW